VFGDKPESDVWLASVYLSHVGLRGGDPAVFPHALADLRTDVCHYQRKPGSVVLAGDFKAGVGSATSARMPAHRSAVEPLHGEAAPALSVSASREPHA
jgi:hypothetical protein